MTQEYKDPAGGTDSTIGSQLRTDHYIKKALIEIQKEAYFGQLASTLEMPKHFGKTMKKFHYMPLLDDRNVNDQGIDASGATIADGNLSGSSRDIGTIARKLPSLSENGGRVNRVGFTRKEIQGTMYKFGFFDEYSQESLDFDTDAELDMHVTREMLRGAKEMTESALQIDLLNAAGVVYYGGEATSNASMTGEDGATASVIDYADIAQIDITLTDNYCPKVTKLITGTRMVDTKTIPGARFAYIGSETQTMFEKMTDYFGNPAFISVEKYAAGTTVARGEIGMVGRLRLIVVPEMLYWGGVGAAVTTNGGYRSSDTGSGERYDVFPILVVGSESFSTIGFQTSGADNKFKIYNKRPGEAVADRTDPYGETGFMSIKWYYGIMVLRPEWIAVAKTVVEL